MKSDFIFKMCLSFIAAPVQLKVEGGSGGWSLEGWLSPLVPLRQAATSSEWTQSHIRPHLCFEGVSAMSSTFLLSELSSKTRRQTQGQDLTLNVANSGMGPRQSFMECPYATRVLWHWKNIFVVHRSSSRTASPQYPVHEEMRWPSPQVSRASWFAWNFLSISTENPMSWEIPQSLGNWEGCWPSQLGHRPICHLPVVNPCTHGFNCLSLPFSSVNSATLKSWFLDPLPVRRSCTSFKAYFIYSIWQI